MVVAAHRCSLSNVLSLSYPPLARGLPRPQQGTHYVQIVSGCPTTEDPDHLYRITSFTRITVVEGSGPSEPAVKDHPGAKTGAVPALGQDPSRPHPGPSVTQAHSSVSPAPSQAGSTVSGAARKATPGSSGTGRKTRKAPTKVKSEDEDEGDESLVPYSKFGLLNLLDEDG